MIADPACEPYSDTGGGFRNGGNVLSDVGGFPAPVASAARLGCCRAGLPRWSPLLIALATTRNEPEPGAGLTNDRLSPKMMGRNDVRLLRRLVRCPEATSHRATEPCAGNADHRSAGGGMFPFVGICAHETLE